MLVNRLDPYPTRLKKPLEQRWLLRQEAVIRGSVDDGPLSAAQLAEFEHKRFLFEPDFLSSDEVQQLNEEQGRLLSEDKFRNRDFSITEPDSNQIRSLFAV